MKNNVTKYGIMLIAAVLLAALAFAGAGAAATTYNTTITTWDELYQNITNWVSTEDELIIVLNKSVQISTASSATYEGIQVNGNVTIKPNASIGTEIVLNANGKGRLFTVKNPGSLTLAGNSSIALNLTGAKYEVSTAQAFGGAILVNGGNLTLNSGAKITNSSVKGASESFGGAVGLIDANFTMNAGSNITGGYSHKIGGAVSLNNSAFVMNGGKISDSVSYNDGGAVSVSPYSQFTMNGDSVIDNCTADGYQGGAIYCYFDGTVTMNGNSSITNCTAAGKRVSTDGQGGGAICAYGTVIMNGNSVIDNCTATNTGSHITNGGGVLVRYDDSSKLEMHGNSHIVNCSVRDNGAGVYVENKGKFIMDGGKITDSKAVRGGGVYVADGGSFEIKGTANVTGNIDTSNNVNNVYLATNNLLKLVDNFTGKLGVVSVAGADPAEDAQFGISDAATFAGADNIHSDKAGSSLCGVVTSDKKLTWAILTVSVSKWSELESAVSEWTNTVYQRTVKVSDNITDRESGDDVNGIAVNGKVLLTTAVDTAGEFKINGNQYGRIFDVKGAGNLTIAENGSKVLNLTNGKSTGDGGAIYVEPKGKLTLLKGATISDSSAKNGGAVALAYDSQTFKPAVFTMNAGDIINCTATNFAGGVMITHCSQFYMTGGNITGCTADVKGAGVYLDNNANNNYPTTFKMTGGNITECIYLAASGSTFAGEYGGLYISGGAGTIGNEAVVDGIHLRVDEYFGDPKKFTVEQQFTNGGKIVNLSLEYPSNPVWIGAVVAKNGSASWSNITMAPKYLKMGYYLTNNGYDVTVTSLKNVSTWTQLAANVSGVAENSVGVIILNDNITDRTAGDNVTGIEVKGLVLVVSNSSQNYLINGNGIGRIFNVTTGTLVLKGGPNDAYLTLTGGTSDTDGGAVYAGKDGNLTVLSGVTITNSSAVNGGGVYVEAPVSGNYNFKIGGNAAVTGNYKRGSSEANNVYLNSTEDLQLKLVHDFNGTIGIAHAVGQTPSANRVFGNASGYSITDGGTFVSDFNGNIIGTVHYVNDLVWIDTTPVYTSSSSKQSGYTVINQTVIDTPKPTVAPTAAPTQAPIVNPTVKPTTQPTTSKSPVPVAGLIAGLGAAALVLARMRK